MNKKKALIAIFGISILLSSGAQAAPSYTFTTLNSLLNDNSQYHVISDINDSGQILGFSYGDNSARGTSFILDGSSKTVFSSNYTLTNMNNEGRAVGGYYDPGVYRFDAGYWNGTSEVILGTLGGRNSFAADINNSNQIVGRSATPRGTGLYEEHATLWDGDQVIDLGVLRNAYKSEATAINDKGQVIGSSNPQSKHHGVLWDDGKAIDMGAGSYLVDINNNGLIAGVLNSHATIWDNNQVIDLGTFGGAYSQANAANDKGWVVGYSEVEPGGPLTNHAFLYDGSNTVDLNSLLDSSVINAGWVLSDAYHITESGMISGNAFNTLTGDSGAYILDPTISPVPEPSAYIMMVAGLGMLGFMSRRRNK